VPDGGAPRGAGQRRFSRPGGQSRGSFDLQLAQVGLGEVDELVALTGAAAAAVTPDEAIEHLRRSGAEFSGLVAGCSAGALRAGGGRVERFAQIAIRHPDDHRGEIEGALSG
jgi:hypothetical protein